MKQQALQNIEDKKQNSNQNEGKAKAPFMLSPDAGDGVVKHYR